ncbi:hypothetical protein [Aeromonas jandaei]|uniref:hypothetical protein n=1 Tax=Aeromonas jandaei TaxID=650 RepID=UPI00067AF71C|nr:hypothetical protein [Aeromonas jandaei]
MKFAFPILTAKGEEFKDVKALTALINGEKSGHYLLGNHNKWHGGIHISDQSAPWCKDKYPVRAIADGKVVAFRMMKDYLTSEFQGESLRYSNCFCLVQHEYCEINAETKAKNEFTFYSLYMHLLPWDKYQSTEKLVLKKGWNARNSVPHRNPNAEQQRADAALPRFTLPKDTELEMDSSIPSKKGSVGGKEYDFIKVKIKSKLSNAQIKEAEKAGVLVSEGSSVWIANSPDAVTFIKPNVPTWLFDQIEAELLTNMIGRSDPVLNGPTGRLMAGDKSVSLPAGTKLQYDAHQLEFHWIGDKSRKMARCEYVTPSAGGAAGSCGMAWVCVEDEFIKVNTRTPSHLGELYVLPSPVPIAAGETIGYLGLVETPNSLIGGKQSKHQVHLEVFTQDPRLDDVLANKAGTKGGATYAKVPADLILHEKKSEGGKSKWVATKDKSQEVLVESPTQEKDAAKQEWVRVSADKYVKKEQVELLSQHDWLKIGFKKVDGSASDGYLDPDAPPTFFTELVKSFDTDKNGELSSKEIQTALQNSGNAGQLQKLIVKHPSEWYEKSSSSSYLWLDKLMTKIGLPDFDLLVDHEKQRIDKLEWMQSATKLKFNRMIWHFNPLSILINITVGSCYKLLWGQKVTASLGGKKACEFRRKTVDICAELWGENKKIEYANVLMACMAVETSRIFTSSVILLKPLRDTNGEYIYNQKGKVKKTYQAISKQDIANDVSIAKRNPVGLIQFTGPAVQQINNVHGTNITKQDLALMDELEQLDYVKKYFTSRKDLINKFKGPEDIYLFIFCPEGVGKDDDYVLYSKQDDHDYGVDYYTNNSSLDSNLHGNEGNNDQKIQKKELLSRLRKLMAEGEEYINECCCDFSKKEPSHLELSGEKWVNRYPTSKNIDDLELGFSNNVRKFISAIESAGGQVRISATYRPVERAYLMHYCWRIAKEGLAPEKVPKMKGVDIDWEHKSKNGVPDKQAAIMAAKKMVSGYNIIYKPSLTSRHTEKKAIDMTITGVRGLFIKMNDGKFIEIKSSDDLYRVGASYRVFKLVSDPPHWSVDGR